MGHLIGAETLLAIHAVDACETRLAAALELLPESGSNLQPVIHKMVRFAACLGTARTLRLVSESNSAQLLQPIVAALRIELGQVPQVSKEVWEVAQDILVRLEEAQDESRNSRLLSRRSG